MLLLVLTCANSLVGTINSSAIANDRTCKREAGALRAVTRVIDAETLKLDDGSQVRLVGALAPRAWDANTTTKNWLPEQAAKAALEKLTSGKSIRLYYLGSQRRDRYGRRLAHVFVKSGPKTRHNDLWLQAEMIKLGHARAYGLQGNFACQPALLEIERVARLARIGLWENAAYAVRSAKKTGELNHYTATYQIVSGTITGVTKKRGVTYLNFGSSRSRATNTTGYNARSVPSRASWRTDFTAYIPKGSAATKDATFFTKDLIGQTVLVRGWVERRNGPAIRIDDISQVDGLRPANNIDR